jgi:hypothetical protein
MWRLDSRLRPRRRRRRRKHGTYRRIASKEVLPAGRPAQHAVDRFRITATASLSLAERGCFLVENFTRFRGNHGPHTTHGACHQPIAGNHSTYSFIPRVAFDSFQGGTQHVEYPSLQLPMQRCPNSLLDERGHDRDPRESTKPSRGGSCMARRANRPRATMACGLRRAEIGAPWSKAPARVWAWQ